MLHRVAFMSVGVVIIAAAIGGLPWLNPPVRILPSPQADSVPASSSKKVVTTPQRKEIAEVQTQKTAGPRDGFPFSNDRGGSAVARVVSPAALPLEPLPLPDGEQSTSGPKPRAVPGWLAGPEPALFTRYTLPPVLPAKARSMKPASPRERLPVFVSARSDDVPEKPKLPPPPKIKPASRDVNTPPPLPVLARPLPNRTLPDDPAADPANDAIVNRPMIVTLTTAAFIRFGLPDPFALAAQIRVKLVPDPGLTPAPLEPKRPK